MNWKQLLTAQRIGQKTPVVNIPSRSVFEQDYDRIIFSHPFRRLQDKTQVHPLPEHDFVHTRLTHSLEVSSVGRSLGKLAGAAILERNQELTKDYTLFDVGAIVAAASLAHDLGNPPFGHAGEDALSDFFKHDPVGQPFQDRVTPAEWIDLTKFEGNAQGFRIINSNQFGLKLTLPILGAFTKYPCPALYNDRDKSRKSQKKFGYYQSEKAQMEEVATNLGLIKYGDGTWCRHPLTFLVEAADDICYNIIDLEDGCRLGLVSLSDTIDLLSPILKQDYKPDKLQQIRGQNEKVGVLRAMAINKLVTQCIDVFLSHEHDLLEGKFDMALTDACIDKGLLDTISKISVQKIYRSRSVVEIEASGHQVLPGLLREFTQAGTKLINNEKSRKYDNLLLMLPEELREAIVMQPGNYYNMLRLIVDYISGLTDRHALSLYRKIHGMSW